MPDLTDLQWQSVLKAIKNEKQPFEIIRGVVKKNDIINMLVWIEELGDQPIPIAAFDYEVTYYYESPRGTVVPTVGSASPYTTRTRVTNRRRREVRTLCPKVGDFILVLKQQGSRRLPVCIGVIKSTNFLG